MVTNLNKSFYLHLSSNPIIHPVNLPNDRVILSAENNEHLYLGMWFTTSNDSTYQMKCNLSHRVFNIVKFYNWLEINEMTPINIKIHC